MAITYTSTSGVLVIPGAYASYTVQNTSSSIATAGVLMLIGEANQGPDFTLEDELQLNSFGPDQQSDVIAKYGSGNLVDAYRGAIVAINDPSIQGSFNRVIIVKTNPSIKAQAQLLDSNSANYAVLADQSYGKKGNLIYFNVTAATAEAKPTTGNFAWMLPIDALNASIRVNGGTEQALSLSGLETPPALVTAINGLTGVTATGGGNRAVIAAVTGNLAVAATGNTVVITYTAPWAVNPSAGDTLFIPTGSAIAGSASANCGSYIVTSSTNNNISAIKIMNAAGSPGSLTAPVTVASTAVVSTTADLEVFAPVNVSTTGSIPLDGVGKSLEINELTTGTDLLSNCAYVLSTSTTAAKVNWISKASGAQLLVSASEYQASLNVTRQSDNLSENLVAGGRIALSLGYTGIGATASAVITDLTLTTTVTGGAGTILTINLADYSTMNDLANYINSQAGYSCVVANPALGQATPVALDNGTFTFGSTFGNKTARLKVDAADMFAEVNDNSALVEIGSGLGNAFVAGAAQAGLPGVTVGNTYLAGGTLAGTTDAIVQQALSALEDVTGNFVVPLMSQDASLDIAAGLTDSSSTYTIAAINAACKTHVIAMSTLKARRRRQAFLSIRGTMANNMLAAYSISNPRCSMNFQDMKDLGLNGIVQFQPWYSAVKAAGGQAAADYRALTMKQVNCSGILQAAGDFKDNKDSNVEDALNAGLLVMQRDQNGGGFLWVSDQTTYSADDNFVFNSIQAVYAADIIASTLEIRLQKAFVGQSIADISAAQALSSISNIMNDMLRLKRIASSSDAPSGYKGAVVNIAGPIMKVALEVKLAGEILFVPIQFTISQVTQTASQQ